MLLAAIVLGAAAGVAYLLILYDNGFCGFRREEVVPRAPEEAPYGSLRTVYFDGVDGTQIEGWLFRPKVAGGAAGHHGAGAHWNQGRSPRATRMALRP